MTAMSAIMMARAMSTLVVTAMTISHEFDTAVGFAQAGEPGRRGCGGGRGAPEGRSQCQKANQCETFHPEFLLAVVIVFTRRNIAARFINNTADASSPNAAFFVERSNPGFPLFFVGACYSPSSSRPHALSVAHATLLRRAGRMLSLWRMRLSFVEPAACVSRKKATDLAIRRPSASFSHANQ
jgi:hypothetical protein